MAETLPRASKFPIVGVGASAGGLEAFSQLVRALPEDCGVAVVFIQHLDPHHESMLSQILSRNTQIAVSEATDRTAVEPNHIYVIPANADLSIQHGVLQVGARKPGHMAVDSFFRALAEDRTDHAIGVVLSGSGSDGALGLAAIKAAGGSTLAQDPQAAKFDDMPRAAIGLGDVAMPDHDELYLVSEIRRLHGHETPAIALTGLASGVERQSIISAGFDECANKPVAPQKLMEIAAALVRRWGTRTNSLPHHDYLNLRL